MKKVFEDFLHLFFPESEVDDEEKTPLWLKTIGFLMIAMVTVLAFLILG